MKPKYQQLLLKLLCTVLAAVLIVMGAAEFFGLVASLPRRLAAAVSALLGAGLSESPEPPIPGGTEPSAGIKIPGTPALDCTSLCGQHKNGALCRNI